MKIAEIRGKSSEDLLDLIGDAKAELFKLRFASVTEKVDNPSRIRELRREVARAKTILRQRELSGEGGSELRAEEGAGA